MKKNHLIFLVSLITIILTVLCLIFIHFPFLGHDYSLIIGWANDYKFAWNNFGVFNIIFSPQRCSGVPVWANPISSNFSLFHVLSILLKDINVIVVYCSIILTVSLYGVRKFLTLFELKEPWISYVSIAWCLQGYITARAIVGHISFINLGLWPLYVYLLVKKSESNKINLLFLILFSIANAHDFYLANIYLFVMFPIAFLIFLTVMKFNKFELDFNWILKRFFISIFVSGLLIAPKLLAALKLTRNFQRSSSFFHVEIMDSLNYIMMNLVMPLPLDYHKMTGWNYGNWESVSNIFPFLFPILICKAALDLKKYNRILISFFCLLSIGVFITNGSYAEFFKILPVVKSFHVNPRWLPILSLGFLGLVILFLNKAQFKAWPAFILIFIVIAIPFSFIGQNYFGVGYLYRKGLDIDRNRLNYCYEPVFGHKLELLPFKNLKGEYFDPRCFISKNKCNDINLKPELKNKLESYSLEPFDE